jgi:hypothetical protein
MAGALSAALVVASAATAEAAPPIRTSAANRVPACVTPDRLMQFLRTRNASVDPRFKDIARQYQVHGEAWKVRWDYAFYQMAIETNFLTYRAPGGRMGDVNPKQNNFAGIGTTGGGVPGDSYPDVSTGVLAQIQHLVVYSGERVAQPVAPRTQLKQDVILNLSAPIAASRAVTFQDLSGRWAVDKAYGRSIDWVADQFRTRFCSGREEEAAQPGPPPGRQRRADNADAAADPVKPAGAAPVAKLVEAAEPAPKGPPVAVARTRAVPLAPVEPSADIAKRAVETARQVGGPVRSALGAVQPKAAPRGETCRVQAATYGGQRTLLIRAARPGEVELTALTVIEGFEASMAQSFIKARAAGGEVIGTFANRDEALARAEQICPVGKG